MKKVIALLCIAGFLCSCQADVEDIIVPEPDLTNDSIYLKTLVQLDTSKTPGSDTMTKVMFSYDGQKRVSRVIFNYYDPGTPGPQGFWYDYRWLYNGNDTLPGRLVLSWGEYASPNPYYRDATFISYTDQLITKDSTVSVNQGDGWRKIRVRYLTSVSSDKYVLTFIRKDLPIPGYQVYPPDTSYSQVQANWNNGNLIFNRDSNYARGFVSEQHREFDSHPNPLRRVSMPGLLSAGLDPLQSRYFTNNMTRLNNNGTSGPEPDMTLEYRYRADGYPVSYKSLGTAEKTVFVYTKP